MAAVVFRRMMLAVAAREVERGTGADMAEKMRGSFVGRIADFVLGVFEIIFKAVFGVIGDIFRRPKKPKSFFKDALRAEDFLAVRFRFINLDLHTGVERGVPVAYLTASGDSYLVAEFPPQNIAEQAFFEAEDPAFSDPLDPPPIDKRIAFASRLVFKVPAGQEQRIPYTLEGLLEYCQRLELSVAPTALPPESRRVVFSPLDLAADTRFVVKPRSGLLRDVRLNNVRIVEGVAVRASENGGANGARQRGAASTAAAANVSRAEALFAESRNRMRHDAATLGRVSAYLADASARREIEAALKLTASLLPRIRAPRDTETALEIPFRLILSPSKFAAWAHAARPVTALSTKRTELWHTRLAARVLDRLDEHTEALRTVRAIWTRDVGFNPAKPLDPPPHDNEPFRTSLDAYDRHNVVVLSSAHNIWTTNPSGQPRRKRYVPEPISVRHLMLSSLGGWLDSRGLWEPTAEMKLSVAEWRHIASMCRDHYVRVVYKGFLWFPRHRAVIIKITERKFHGEQPSNAAYMRQSFILVVRDPVVEYPETNFSLPSGASYDRQWPFRSIRIITLITPKLDKPENSDFNVDPDLTDDDPTPQPTLQSMFWPKVGGEYFRFHCIAEDFDGQQVEFLAPLMFVDNTLAQNPQAMARARAFYEFTGPEELRRIPMNGKHLMYAPSIKSGDTSYETRSITFGVNIPNDTQLKKLGPDSPRFYPAIRKFDAVVPAIKYMVGNTGSTSIRYNLTYLKEGFPDQNAASTNKGEVFAELADGSVGFNFSGKGDRSGGLVMPNIDVRGLSRALGPVAGAASGDLSEIIGGQFNPKTFFEALGAKIFGVIDLWDVIEAAGVDEGMEFVPKFITEAFTGVQAFLQNLEAVKSGVTQAAAANSALAALKAALVADYTTLTGHIENILKGTPPSAAQLQADLTSFAANLQALDAQLPTALAAPELLDLRRSLENSTGQFLADLANVAAFITRLTSALQVPDELKVRFDWKPKLKSWPSAKPLFRASDNGKAATLTIAVELSAKTNLSVAPTAKINCSLRNFTVDLIGNVQSFILIHFDKVEFSATVGRKPDVDVLMRDIEFVGVLSFVEALKSLIPLDGFSDPPAVAVTEEGIEAGFSMALPNIAFGVFSLQNLSLGAGFQIPFIANPLSVRFNFCERHAPFLLTVSMFGGGGFFAITLDPAGVQLLEASFEFGASISIDFGVASGGIYVMAGIYFRLEIEDGHEKAALTGYLRMGGEVDVLGLISASIELYMELTYEFSSGKCIGRASLTIEVEVLFFSASVTISCERKFAGSNGDPTFAQLMEPYEDPFDTGALVNPWDEYCDAFAAL